MSKTLKQLSGLVCALSVVMIITLFPLYAAESIKASGKRCIESLLPGIFPMMILARQIAENELICDGKGAKILSILSGFPKAIVPVFLAGALCGYPVPAIICKKFADNGKISEKQALVATYISNGASPGFLIFYVGGVLAGSISFGVCMYISQLISSVIISHLSRQCKTQCKTVSVCSYGLANNIKESCIAFTQLCGFVVFFSLVSDCCRTVLCATKLPAILTFAVSGIFEITGALSGIAPFSNGDIFPVCLMCSCGGLSVIFQIKSVMEGYRFRPIEFLFVRIAVALLMTVFMSVFNIFSVFYLQ